mmetsp:Transcript_49671/g.146818  ORF Transcript_49671/g.146818 Transcript_49671/m.146818 type:complete len:217 (+) Transcript_49671:1950-2600(+)
MARPRARVRPPGGPRLDRLHETSRHGASQPSSGGHLPGPPHVLPEPPRHGAVPHWLRRPEVQLGALDVGRAGVPRLLRARDAAEERQRQPRPGHQGPRQSPEDRAPPVAVLGRAGGGAGDHHDRRAQGRGDRDRAGVRERGALHTRAPERRRGPRREEDCHQDRGAARYADKGPAAHRVRSRHERRRRRRKQDLLGGERRGRRAGSHDGQRYQFRE